MQISSLPGFRYAVALFFVGAALLFSLIVRSALHEGFLIFFLCGVMLAGWYGRTAAGLFAVVVSMIVVDYFFISPHRTFGIEVEELPYFLSFLLCAVVSSFFASARRTADDKQKAHLDELFEQTPDAIMLVDLHGRILRVNKKFSQIFGYTPEEIVSHATSDLIVPDRLKAEAQEIRLRLVSGEDVSVETTRQRKNGSSVDVSEVSFPVVAGGKCLAYYVVLRDISESKRALEELQQAQAELAHLSRITTMGELASSIAHEINQPIGAMVTNGNAAMRWLAQQPPNLQGAGEALDCIVRDGNRAAAVVGRIRSLLRKNSPPMVDLDINEVIREVLVLTSDEINRRGIIVVTELDDTLPLTLGDRVQLQQVMLNLIMNGLDAMADVTGDSAELRIKSSKSRDSVLVQVLDCGCGLPNQRLGSIFDPFFTTKEKGIGMGLTISRSIIESHGGRLWAEPRSPKGAVLHFTLPGKSKAQ